MEHCGSDPRKRKDFREIWLAKPNRLIRHARYDELQRVIVKDKIAPPSRGRLRKSGSSSDNCAAVHIESLTRRRKLPLLRTSRRFIRKKGGGQMRMS